MMAAEAEPPLISPQLHAEHCDEEGLVLSWDDTSLVTDLPLQTLVAIPDGTPIEAEIEVLRVDDRSARQDGWAATAPPTLAAASPELEYPTPRVTVRPLGYVGRCRVASIQVRPTVHKFHDGRSYTAAAVAGRVSVRWPTGTVSSGPTREPRPFFDELLQATVLNYPPPFTSSPSVSRETIEEVPEWLPDGAWRFRMLDEGPLILHLGDFRRIRPAGAAIRATDIVASSSGRTLPILVLDSENQPVSQRELVQTDRVLIWAPSPEDPYTDHRVVTVHLSGNLGRIMPAESSVAPASTSSATEVITLERDRLFYPEGEANERQDKFWVWEAVEPSATTTIDIALSAPRPKDSLQHVDLFVRSKRAFVLDATPVWPQILEINGRMLNTEVQQGEEHEVRVITAPLPAGLLHDATNRVKLGFPAPTRKRVQGSKPLHLYLDRIVLYSTRSPGSVRIGRTVHASPGRLRIDGAPGISGVALDVSDPWQPRHLQRDGKDIFVPERGAQTVRVALVSTSGGHTAGRRSVRLDDEMRAFLDPGQPTDMVLVGPRVFQEHLRPWTDLLEQRGLSVAYVSLEPILDVFGDGEMRPSAIKNLAAHAVSHWPGGGPSWLLLVGDATWDTKGRFGNNITNIVPAFRGDENYAVESWFGTVFGTDDLPDLMVARLPVRDTGELDRLVSKLVRQELGRQKPEPWRNRVLLLTDDEFEQYMDPISASGLPQEMRHDHLFVADEPLVDNFYLPEPVQKRLKSKTSTVLTDKVVSSLNEGVWLWEFFGHGAPNVLAHERAFFGGGSKFSDVKRLSPDSPPTMLWAFTCETGSFDYAKEKWNISIGEDMLVRHDGGAVCLVVATGRGFPRDHALLCQGMHDAMFTRGLGTVGQVVLAANLMAMAQRTSFEPLRQFAILGDPLVGPTTLHRLKGKAEWSADHSLDFEWTIPETFVDTQATVWWRDGRGRENLTQQRRPDAGKVSGTMDINTDGRSQDPGWLGIELRGADDVLLAHGAERIPSREALPVPPLILSGSPDLAVVSAEVRSPTSPYTGQTIFIEAVIHNEGVASATNVRIEAYDGPHGEGGESFRRHNRRGPAILERIDPGERSSVTLRWDPSENAGDHELQVVVDPNQKIAESREDNNALSLPLHVRQKANLVVRKEDVTLTPIETGYRLDFIIRNIGNLQADRVQAEVRLKRRGTPEPIRQILPPKEGVTETIEPGGVWINSNLKIRLSDLEWAEIEADPEGVVDEESHDDNRFRASSSGTSTQ